MKAQNNQGRGWRPTLTGACFRTDGSFDHNADFPNRPHCPKLKLVCKYPPRDAASGVINPPNSMSLDPGPGNRGRNLNVNRGAQLSNDKKLSVPPCVQNLSQASTIGIPLRKAYLTCSRSHAVAYERQRPK